MEDGDRLILFSKRASFTLVINVFILEFLFRFVWSVCRLG